MEILDLYDENYHKTGKTIIRGKKPNDGYYIRVVVIYIENSKHEFLFQMTSKEKKNVYAVTGGHVKSGQTPLQAIQEEVKEELGIILDKKKIKHIFRNHKNQVILDAYYIKMDLDIKDLKLQKEEVEYVKWFTKDELKKIRKQKNIREASFYVMEQTNLL